MTAGIKSEEQYAVSPGIINSLTKGINGRKYLLVNTAILDAEKYFSK